MITLNLRLIASIPFYLAAIPFFLLVLWFQLAGFVSLITLDIYAFIIAEISVIVAAAVASIFGLIGQAIKGGNHEE